MTRPVGVILAGGLARRMGGGDKCRLDLGGQTLLEHGIDRLAPQVSEMILNANGDPLRFQKFGLPVAADTIGDFPGPLAGILAGMEWAAIQGGTHIVSIAADTPFFPTNLVTGLEQAASKANAPIALAATPDAAGQLRRHPTFGLWDVELRSDLAEALDSGVRKIVAWADNHKAATAVFSGDKMDPFFNVNTPDDLKTAARYLAGHST